MASQQTSTEGQSSSSSSTDAGVAARAALEALAQETVGPGLSMQLEDLKQKRAEISKERKRLAMEEKNAKKRKKRLLNKCAGKLTLEDMMQVVVLQKMTKDKSEAHDDDEPEKEKDEREEPVNKDDEDKPDDVK